jgi:hypothetical protein
MSSSGDVTHWLRLLKDGERGSVQRLWQRYYRALVGLARQKRPVCPVPPPTRRTWP